MVRLMRPPVPSLEALVARGSDLGGCARISSPRQQSGQGDSSSGVSSKRISKSDLPNTPMNFQHETTHGECERLQSEQEVIPRKIRQTEIAMVTGASACQPSLSGALAKRPRKMVAVAACRTARAVPTTPSRSCRNACSREGSPASPSTSRRNVVLREESPRLDGIRQDSQSTKALDDEGIVRARARLFELLNSAAVLVSRSEEPVFNDESRPCYERFIRGYLGTTARHVRNRTILEESVAKVVGEDYNELTSFDRRSPRERTDDHYKYFSRQDLSESQCHCKEDNDRRLQRVRLQALAARVALTVDEVGSPPFESHLGATGRPAWSLDSNLVDVRKTGRRGKDLDSNVCVKFEDPSKPPKKNLDEMLESFEREGSPIGSDHCDETNRSAKLKKQGVRQTLFQDDGETFGHRARGQRSKLRTLKTETHFSSNTVGVATTLKSEMRTREACESLRFLVFGYISEGKRSNGAFYEQSCGSKDEVMKLHSIWNQMDEDGSGDIEFTEFLSYFSKSKADRLLGMKCVKYLVGTGNDATGCNIEDMMKLIWLKATKADLDLMMHWFKEAEYQRFRAPTPPLLPKRKRREILENFPSLELGAKISYEDLVDTGLVDEPTAKQLQYQHDQENTNVITVSVLLDMMCPNGYRSRMDAPTAVDKDGRSLEYINNKFYTGWIYLAKRSGDSDSDGK